MLKPLEFDLAQLERALTEIFREIWIVRVPQMNQAKSAAKKMSLMAL